MVKRKSKAKITIGRMDIIDLPEFGLVNMEAKIDTGALTSAIHCSRIKLVRNGEKEYISFMIPGTTVDGIKGVKFKTTDFKQRNIKSSNGHIESRYVIKTDVAIFGRKIRTEFSLTDRSVMKFPILLGRKLLRNRFIVDVSKVNLSHQEKLTKTSSKSAMISTNRI